MASPFASHLGTNYCPKDDELLKIRAFLVEPTRRLRRLDDEIAELQKSIDKLAEERHSLQTYVDGHKALISPARRLPLDVIQEIFVACIPTHRNCVMSASEAPVLLGRICSSWRAISLTTPHLWARLHIVEPLRGRYGATDAQIETKVEQRLAIAKTWLERSGQCPLSISLQCGWEKRRFDTTYAAAATVGDRVWAVLAVDVPTLESAAFDPHLRFPPGVVNWEHLGLLSGPRLTSFCTIRSGHNLQSLRAIRWHQLTELTIGGDPWETSITSETLLQTLSQCKQLRTCSVATVAHDGDYPNPVSHSQHPLVELAFLHTFTLDSGTFVCSVLDRLSLPQLRDFTLHGLYQRSLAPFFGLCFHLETLRLDSNSFKKSIMQGNLRALPATLLHLTIRDDTMHGRLTQSPLGGFARRRRAGIAHPQTLTITHCCTISDAALLQFVTGRMALAHSDSIALKRIEVEFKRPMTQDITPALAPFIERGLHAVISYDSPPTTQLSPWQGLADAPVPQWSNDLW
ncbi:hypothetical protein MSAN_00087200 [Mycena sanguinolenta]|uniref:F-box domain-containing protein n=1 Tax=Mycena sanguinolenta TaxID=230812 RepID=A0A8H6ZFZ0_9AGAR|nr:hypothetical protein MSAN_00087200 [Mycena sanguinolenta]